MVEVEGKENREQEVNGGIYNIECDYMTIQLTIIFFLYVIYTLNTFFFHTVYIWNTIAVIFFK